MKNNLLRSLSLSLLVVFLGAMGCEPPAEDGEEAAVEVAVQKADEAAQDDKAEAAPEPVEFGELPDEKERMSELLKMEQKAAETAVTAENADEVAAKLEAEIEADLE